MRVEVCCILWEKVLAFSTEEVYVTIGSLIGFRRNCTKLQEYQLRTKGSFVSEVTIKLPL